MNEWYPISKIYDNRIKLETLRPNKGKSGSGTEPQRNLLISEGRATVQMIDRTYPPPS